jgi:LDH2 family malate/lactate/ureidoglycolate dehydrogenase
MTLYRQIEITKLRSYCEKLFRSYEFSDDESQIITKILLRADLYGIESHGVQRLMRYHKEIKSGMVDVKARPEIVRETAVSAVIDARKAMGQLVSFKAMRQAIEKAKTSGFGAVTVRNSNHFGIAGYYTLMAAEEDLMGIAMTNSEAIAVPTYGREAMLGTNPIALAMPACPCVFSYDAATTVVPRGKLEVYNKNGKSLPGNWVLDARGLPSKDSEEVLKNIIGKLGGGILPLGGEGELYGGHKGYGLGVIVDIFTAIMSGGLSSNYVNRQQGLNGICHCFIALDYGIFGSKTEIKKHFSTFLQELRDSKKAEGQNRIYIHGEKEAEMMASRLEGSVPVNEKTLEEMKEIAAAQGIPWEAL